MKKTVFIFLLILSTFFIVNNVEAKSYTINTDLFGDVVVDTDVLEQENDIHLVNDTFIVAKRNNGTDLVLLTFNNDGSNKDTICKQYGYTGTKIRYTCVLHLFLYDNENKNWIKYSNVYQYSINNGNFYYMTFKYLNPIDPDKWEVDYSKHYLLMNGYLNLYEGEYVDIPKIQITKNKDIITTINNVDYITSVEMTISSSTNDDSKYICMVSTDAENWDYYSCSYPYIYTMKENGTLYAQVLDKTTEKSVSTATYTIDNIEFIPSSEDMVSIYFQKITEDVDSTLYNQCTISQGSVSYRACETLSISFDVINYNKYIYQMSLDDGNTWEDVSSKIYNNFYLERVFDNKSIHVRVLNKEDNSLNNISTFITTTIESTEELGQKVMFWSNYYSNSPDVEITALFLNYDSSKYNYYYSFFSSSDSFTDITDSIDCKNNLCTYKINVFVKGTVYVKIEDKEGNLIYTATHTVDYYKWIDNNDSFGKDDFFSTFFDSFDYFLNPIKEIFNSITIFFDSLPLEIKYTFYVAFVIIIILYLVKFIL